MERKREMVCVCVLEREGGRKKDKYECFSISKLVGIWMNVGWLVGWLDGRC